MKRREQARCITVPALLTIVLATCIGVDPDASARTSAETPRGGLPYYGDASFTPSWFAEGAPAEFHAVPDFELVTQTGEAVTKDVLSGKIYIANFFFTDCAGICPLTMANLTHLHAELADDPGIVLVSHSVAPERDDVERLGTFAHQIGAVPPQWYLLTGETEALYNLGRVGYFADEDLGEARSEGGPDRFLHSESFYLVDQSHHIRGIYNGMSRTAVNHLLEDIGKLQQEAPPIGHADRLY